MFYKDGLSFECQRCLYCCSSEPGYVFLSDNDINRAAAVLGVPREEFIAIYCRKIDYGQYYLISLKEKDNYDCEFLTKQGCSIYEGRPEQCRTYPFWKTIMESQKAWKEEGNSCPGIGKGHKIPAEVIEDNLRRGEENIPFIVMKKKKF